MTVQWVQLRGGETLVASRKGAWIQPPQAAALALWGSMPASHTGTLETTRHLLDGAMSAGERGAAVPGTWPPSARRWALDLVDQWYTAHHSVALLSVAIERYESMRRPELVRFARHKLEEEAGHDRLALDDLRALGYDPEAATKEVAPGPTARAIVGFARDCVHGPEPVSFLGYIFMLERRVIRITEAALQQLDRALPSGVQATSAVRAHAVEFDHQHVEELVAFVSGLPADDRTAVALACFETASLLSEAAPGNSDDSDLDREHRLERARTPTIQATQTRSK